VASVERFRDLLAVADSSPLFSLTTAAQVQEKLSYLNTGAGQLPGLLVMHLDDTVGEDVDPARERVVVLINATDSPQTYTAVQLATAGLTLSSVQAGGADPVVKGATFANGTFTVPARTTAVFEERSPCRSRCACGPVTGRASSTSGRAGPVAVLSQDGFDPVADLDRGSLRFGVRGPSRTRCAGAGPGATTTGTASSTCSARCASARAGWGRATRRCCCAAAPRTACASSARRP
jgi:hypothetical protein